MRLNLPNQRTPKDRKFGIEGVVDIIREETRTTMYDIKTHDPEFIRQNIGLYQDQLNIYAHIWCKLRGQQLTDTAVVSTHVPDSVKGAFRSGNAEQLAKAMEQWEPVIPIEFDPDNVETTIKDFGDVVDKIEGGKFSSPSVAKLRKLESASGHSATACAETAMFDIRARLTGNTPTRPAGRTPPGSPATIRRSPTMPNARDGGMRLCPRWHRGRTRWRTFDCEAHETSHPRLRRPKDLPEAATSLRRRGINPGYRLWESLDIVCCHVGAQPKPSRVLGAKETGQVRLGEDMRDRTLCAPPISDLSRFPHPGSGTRRPLACVSSGWVMDRRSMIPNVRVRSPRDGRNAEQET